MDKRSKYTRENDRMNPLISVIVPCYNVELYLERCIESILAQKYNNYELILVDDGSPDSSGAICDAYAEQHSQIKVIHKENGGLSDARNVGIAVARGEYVIFPDSDDWLSENLFLDLRETLESTSFDIISFGRQIYYSDQEQPSLHKASIHHLTGIEALNDMLASGNVTSFANDKFYRKSLFTDRKIKFPIGAYYEDLGTIYKLLMVSSAVYHTTQPYYCYFLGNENSITQNFSDKKIGDMFSFYEEIYNTLIGNREINQISLKRYYANGLIYLISKIYQLPDLSQNPLDKMKLELSRLNISLLDLKNYYNFKKYILYRLHLLKLFFTIQRIIKGSK